MGFELVQEVINAEHRLKASMIGSDIAALDSLLADNLVFINHFGHRVSKQDDLALHQSGLLSISSIELSDLQIEPHGNSVLVYVNADIVGTYNGADASGRFVFSRVWLKEYGKIQVVSAHSTMLL
ncbi:nuclear transport factor 2 family protein [Vibrio sp. 404]|uniref:Nuclear transport factor 2 family protein n=1 Tax=Vibrio marinisediminis TaxID=2758441 RepID=A0A7W2FRS9_9VIBR|nr:nuclear transport factor 2 family protein [Vibrio marinisediminis]MBA5763098.1 nuclear transport factor 2 family protein [Vibrio marinisediminis]